MLKNRFLSPLGITTSRSKEEEEKIDFRFLQNIIYRLVSVEIMNKPQVFMFYFTEISISANYKYHYQR